MRWIWDNIVHDRNERSRSIFFISLLATFVFIKMYLLYVYEPKLVPVDETILADIQVVDVSKTNNHNKSENRSSFPKTQETKTKNYPNSKPSSQSEHPKQHQAVHHSPSSFYFDPNTTTRDSLKLLGLSDYSVNSILKYRSKGGKFRDSSQLSKVNGIDSSTLSRLMPYVSIADAYRRKKNFVKKKPQIIDINLADTTAFKTLYGIGPYYASQIVKYRDHLGGYISIDQVAEVYGLPDSTFQKIKPYLKCDPKNFTKFNINDFSRDALGRHPYISWQEAKAIDAYKSTHGHFTDIDDLYKLYALTKEKVDTIKYYFDVK